MVEGSSFLWDCPVGNGASSGLVNKWKDKSTIRKKQNSWGGGGKDGVETHRA